MLPTSPAVVAHHRSMSPYLAWTGEDVVVDWRLEALPASSLSNLRGGRAEPISTTWPMPIDACRLVDLAAAFLIVSISAIHVKGIEYTRFSVTHLPRLRWSCHSSTA